MKFVIVGTAYPLRGGIAHYVSLLYQALRDRGHEVLVVTFSRQYPKILFPGTSQEEKGDAGMPIPSEAIIDSVNPATWRAAGKRIADFDPDAVLFKFWLPFFAPAYGMIARIAKKQLRKRGKDTKIVFIADNVIPHEKRIGDRAATNYAFNVADHFIVQSSAVEADLKTVKPEARYTKLAHPIYNIFGDVVPRDEARKRLSLEPDAQVLLFFGFIRKYKGLDIAIGAMPAILKKYPKAILLGAGESYTGDEEYRKLIDDLGLRDHVRLNTDYIANDEVRYYFSAANVAVLPYRSATQSGIVQIAYNFDTPVIATNVGGLAEVVIDGISGLIAHDASPEAITRCVLAYFDANLEGPLRDGVREEKKQYSWETFAEGVERIARS
jgi:glycosyltransferase involved in cell wall biosynthesis